MDNCNKYLKPAVLGTLFALMFLLPAVLFSQQAPKTGNTPQKFALVIGNGAYTSLTPLNNPVNDANDVASALLGLGFTVDKILNGNHDQMDSAILLLKERLSASPDAYGFFFYAGHGVQSGGENYLIPVNANIPGENYLRSRAVSVQLLLDELNDARNKLNMVILDACRDNPFSWSRTANRGLALVTRQPADSIIVFATSAGQRASDGEGRNGLFTSQFLPHLVTPGLEVSELFKRTGADVAEISKRQQVPAIYNQFFGTAYLGRVPSGAAAGYVPGSVRPMPQPLPGTARKAERTPDEAAKLWTVGASLGTSFSAPWFIGTAHGTVAPFKYSFLELGFDAGFLSGAADVGYYSLYPFVHYAYFLPFTLPVGKGLGCGWYIGAGGGYMHAKYDYPEGIVSLSIFSANLVTGFNIGNVFDISYTLRTDFSTTGGKLSAGYTYRFK